VKHHFNPAFSLKPWAGTDGLVCQMRFINGRVVHRRFHPNATGYERDLYKTDGLTQAEEHHLEENFFKPVDTAANLALQKMLAWDKAPWTSEMRSAWTRYLLSLRFRNPDTVKDLKTHMLNIWSTAQESIKKDFAKWRRPDDPLTWEEFDKLLNPAAPHVGATDMMIRIVDNDRIGPTIFGMHWSIHKLVDSKVRLLMSDRPLNWPAGLASPKAYIALAISPDTVFLASNDPEMQSWAKSQPHTQLAKGLNKSVVTQAREYIWGTDDSQIEFVRKHFGKAPIYSAITEAQKAASLRAAAGEKIEPAA
jgi:hypothetical protein